MKRPKEDWTKNAPLYSSNYSIWSALFSTHEETCYTVEFGEHGGEGLPLDVVLKLARQELKSNDELQSLNFVRPGDRKKNKW